MKTMKNNCELSQINLSNDSDFFEQLKVVSKLIKTKKSEIDITEIYLSQLENNQIINVFWIIKFICKNDFDSIFDLYKLLNSREKLDCLETITNLSTNPLIINWIAQPKINLADLKKVIILKKIKLSQFLLINRLSELYSLFINNKLRTKSKSPKIITAETKNDAETEDYNETISELDRIIYEIINSLTDNDDLFDWFLHNPKKEVITNVLRLLTNDKNRDFLVSVLNAVKC